jgi:SAM-dependent methyltransferase
LNETYGYQLGLTTKLRPWRLSTDRRQRWDKHCGYLKFPGPGARLLDIGCGNGRFLLQMRALGWDVAGVEPDPKSAAEAVAAGLKVRQGLLEPGTQPGNYFDAVTLNHVIEHLHDPVKTLSLSRQALKPGGVIYLATPNFAAGGHRLFGADWFPLDPPRHLVLFTPQSLRRALERAGFEPEPSIRPRFTALEMFSRSAHLQRGSDPMREEPTLPFTVKLKIARLAREADRATRADINLTEELVQLASRP